MGPLLSTLGSVAALAGLGGILLLLPLIWIFAPLVPVGGSYPFESPLWRAVLCAVPVLLYLAVVLVAAQRRRRRDAALVEAAAAPDPAAERAAEEEAEIRERLQAALASLRRATGGKGHLYELPWYVLIGPPGSGKTTALANSGLEFPLAEGAKLQGVGGTRFCEWWLSDRAVLIDTAGRYTTQDSDAAADKAGWERFLLLLRRNRPRLPLNGVIVCFGVDLIGRLGPAEREAHAQSVRRRIKELETTLAQRLPVYLVISKADLLPGFVEFFDDLDREARAQVWGMTFPLQAGPEGPAAKFGAEFKALLQRLEDRLFERLQAERGPEQRARIAGFPAQFASLEEPLAAFLGAAFGGTRLDPAPFLRGVYFTSGTQEGTPLDRLSGALSRAFGLDPRRPAAVMGQKGRSYFLGRLLKEVVFNEARLAARDRAVERGRRIAAVAVWVGSLLLVGGGALWGWTAWQAEQRRAGAMAAAVAKAEEAARTLPLARVEDPEPTRVVPYLEATRALPPAARSEAESWLGLSQADKLAAAGEAAYRRALDRALLPRLLARLETQIRGAFQRPDYLYEAVRVYLMLGREGPLDGPLVREWFRDDWARSHPGATNQPLREALARHLDALLETDFEKYPLDGALVDQARRVFSRLPLAGRIYSRLRPLAQNAENAPGWKPADAIGAAGARYFVRASGRPLTEVAVPGLYTVEGLHRVVLPNLPRAVREAAAESWVLGPEARAAGAEDPARLEAAVLALYAEDYARAWQAALDDLQIPQFRTLQEAAEGLNLLGAPNSPIRDVMRAIARQLSVGTSPDPAPQQDPAQQRVQAATGAPRPSSAEPVARIVEARFQALREAAGQPTDEALRIVNDLFVRVAQLVSAPPGTVLPPPAGLDPGQRLMAEAARQPEPLARWLRNLAVSTAAQRGGGARAAIAAAGKPVMDACRDMLARFPFRLDGPDPPVDDFARLFGPGGQLDQFFTQHIRPYVDTTQNPWRPIAPEGMPPVVSAADALNFQRAARIRDAFWPGVGSGGLRFEVVPRGFDPGARGMVLEVEGTRTEVTRDGPFRPIALGWPARGGLTLTFEPPAPGGAIAYDGGWSALRLVLRPQSRLTATRQPDRLNLTVAQGERTAEFELRTGSAVHPFGLGELREFRCPTLPP
ncbi:type VI secretion system membrane subunit TssM [Caldovatus aquaticus]|uniref:Type VI secretion system membrane subunit TssM n=1 Tax=Caldovatus aquaticus TaxID=2865671 RepID=A0ABS7F5Z5_9PROT|nr:type VI secretion system membrane subunit TssM [Caldovatus aquaticus]MBW8270231.1 type VI secretion system membrane subunit TssM [Caldovatus aquaticus]